MKDPRPYIFSAHIEWLDDSGARPHIVIQNGPKTNFPPSLMSHSLVTFNISGESVKNLFIDESGMSFHARFNGKEFTVFAPLDCLMQLHSGDGQIRIGLQANVPTPIAGPTDEQLREASRQALANLTAEAETKQSPPAEKPKLAAIKGGTSDGIPRGNLSLVPKVELPMEPVEPEQA